MADGVVVKVRWNLGCNDVIQVLCVETVEPFVTRLGVLELRGKGGLDSAIWPLKNAALHFRPNNHRLHNDLGIMLTRQNESVVKFIPLINLGNTDGGSTSSGLHKHRKTQKILFFLGQGSCLTEDDVTADGEPFRRGQFLRELFVHRRGRRQYTCTDVRDRRHIKEPLDGAVFTETPVEDGENDVDVRKDLTNVGAVRIDKTSSVLRIE